MNRSLMFRLLLVAVGVIVLAGGAVIAMEPELAKIHKRIASDYKTVEHIDGTAFEALPESDVIVFDVREPEEFGVSHIKGAIQVDPGIKPEEFTERFSEALNGKTIVFYCSVGRRSSLLAERVDSVVAASGANASYNLIGGIFQWHNEDRPLTNSTNVSTDSVHPYNSHWGRLIEDKSAIRYTPDNGALRNDN